MINSIKNAPIPTPDNWYSEKALEYKEKKLNNDKINNSIIYHVKMKYDPKDITPVSFIPNFDSILRKHIENENNNSIDKIKETNVLYL